MFPKYGSNIIKIEKFGYGNFLLGATLKACIARNRIQRSSESEVVSDNSA